jgi:tRNA pseudouridine55 synthase
VKTGDGIKSSLNGLLVIDKLAQRTSHDVVQWVRRRLGVRRVGHTGTLDPLATGVLVLCVGQATRLAEYLSASRKAYLTEIVFGVETDTLDITGKVVRECDVGYLTAEALKPILKRFCGLIQQVPPMVSAKRHQGRRLYDLAREGQVVERPPQTVQIERLELLDFRTGDHPVAKLEVVCSSGTYIRSLAADLGAALGVGGTMQSLRRIWVGVDEQHAFTLAQAVTLDVLEQRIAEGRLHEVLLPPLVAMAGRPQVVLSEPQVQRIRHGQAIPLSSIEQMLPASPNELCALLDADGNFIGVGRIEESRLQPVKVLHL